MKKLDEMIMHFDETVDFGADFGVSDRKTSLGFSDIFVTKINH